MDRKLTVKRKGVLGGASGTNGEAQCYAVFGE